MNNCQRKYLIGIGYMIMTLLIIFPESSQGQTRIDLKNEKRNSDDTTTILSWFKDLSVAGVSVEGDTLILGDEVIRLLTDEQSRDSLYPKTYKWEMAIDFIQKQELKKAYWIMLNLYLTDEKNKELVVKSFLFYNQILNVKKILLNSFYTYIFTDPEVGNIVDGRSRVTSPYNMDKKVNAVKEILYYLDKYKENNEQQMKDKSDTKQ